MHIPTEIMFHQLDHSDAVETSILRWVARLEPFSDRIVACTVTVALPHRRHRHGGEFSVNVVLDIPGGQITASNLQHADIYVAVADSFRAIRRQLAAHAAVHRGFAAIPRRRFGADGLEKRRTL